MPEQSFWDALKHAAQKATGVVEDALFNPSEDSDPIYRNIGKPIQQLLDKVPEDSTLGYLRKYLPSIDVGMIGPGNMGGVVFKGGARAFHGTRAAPDGPLKKSFDYFDQRNFGAHSHQPGAQLIHAGMDPEVAVKVAKESRTGNPIRGLGMGNAGVALKPIEISPRQEFLWEEHITPQDVERILQFAPRRAQAAKRLEAYMNKRDVPTADYDRGREAIDTANGQLTAFTKLREAFQQSNIDHIRRTIFDSVDPRTLERAGFAGVLYDDVAGPAVAFTPHAKLTTPWGTPHTKGRTTLERAILRDAKEITPQDMMDVSKAGGFGTATVVSAPTTLANGAPFPPNYKTVMYNQLLHHGRNFAVKDLKAWVKFTDEVLDMPAGAGYAQYSDLVHKYSKFFDKDSTGDYHKSFLNKFLQALRDADK